MASTDDKTPMSEGETAYCELAGTLSACLMLGKITPHMVSTLQKYEKRINELVEKEKELHGLTRWLNLLEEFGDFRPHWRHSFIGWWERRG